MANEVLLKVGTQICFADHASPDYGSGGEGDFSPTAANDLQQGTPTKVLLEFEDTGVGVVDGAARESAKVDLGPTRAAAYAIKACIEFAATPTAGDVVELYWNASPDATAANGNMGGATGSDGAYPSSGTLADLVKQLELIGVFVCVGASGVQIADCGVFSPSERYGSLIVKNESGIGFFATDDAESHIVFNPIVDEIQ